MFSFSLWLMPRRQASACNTDNTQTQPHQISNTQRTENKTTHVVIQRRSHKLLMVDILISETCWAHKKWNKIASDVKLVFYYSTIKTDGLLKFGCKVVSGLELVFLNYLVLWGVKWIYLQIMVLFVRGLVRNILETNILLLKCEEIIVGHFHDCEEFICSEVTWQKVAYR